MTTTQSRASWLAPNLTIVDAIADDRLAEWLVVSNATTDRPSTLEDLTHSIKSVSTQMRLLAIVDGEAVATVSGVRSRTKGDGVFYLTIRTRHAFRKRGIASALYEHAVQWCINNGAHAIQAFTRDNQPEAMLFWQNRGFEIVENYKMVELVLADWKPREIEEPAVTIKAVAQEPNRLRELYDIAATIWKDQPRNDESPERTITFDEYCEFLEYEENRNLESFFFAEIDGNIVGYAQLALPPAVPSQAWHNFTGVVREYRGQGIAKQLKVHSISWAQQNGFASLITGNHEDNGPMRHINMELGYKPMYGEVSMKRLLA